MAVIAIYSSQTGRVRRLISDGRTAAALAAANPPGPGEAWLEVTAADPQSLASLKSVQAAVSIMTGKVPAGDRYVLVRGGAVVDVIRACPVCDDLTGWVQDDAAGVGYRQLSDRTFVPGDAEIDAEVARLQSAIDTLPDARDDPDAPLTQGEINRRIAFLEEEKSALEAVKART